MRVPALLSLMMLVALSALAGDRASNEDAARSVARAFGQALVRGDASLLQPILPARGKVRMHLTRLGPEEGTFSASQVQAVLGNFLQQGSVSAFDVMRVESDGEGYAVICGRASAKDRQGRAVQIKLHFSLQMEGERWVLEEIRENSP